jgi:branched-chain amino acid aminotransferase
MKNLFFYDDKIQSESDCKINILSPTVQYGLNVFEGIRCYYDKKTQDSICFRIR